MQNLEGWQNATLGALAGPSAMPFSQMFIYWKNSYAILGQPFSMNPRNWYRGLPVSMMLQGPVNGSQFVGAGLVMRAFGGQEGAVSDTQIMIAGMSGGMISGLVCAPQEVLMVQQQKNGGTLAGTAGRIVREFGVTRIMRGLPATSFREGFYTLGFLSLAPIFAQKMRQREGFTGSASDEFQARMTGAVLGGWTGAVLSHPIDFIKTNQQGDVEKQRLRGFFHTGATLFKEVGPLGFFRGLPWRACGIIINAFMINNFKDLYAPIIFPGAFK